MPRARSGRRSMNTFLSQEDNVILPYNLTTQLSCQAFSIAVSPPVNLKGLNFYGNPASVCGFHNRLLNKCKWKSFLMPGLNTDPGFFTAQRLRMTFLDGRASSRQLSNLYLQSFWCELWHSGPYVYLIHRSNISHQHAESQFPGRHPKPFIL